MKTLGCTMCILAFSPFSAEINELKEKKTRIHIVHPSFFILQRSHGRAEDEKKTRMQFVRASFFFLQLTGRAAVRKVKAAKARMHILHPGFCILQITQSAEITK